MSSVVVKNGDLNGAIRMLKQKNAKDNLPKEVRKREHYSKPGEVRRIAKQEAVKNARRRERMARSA